MCSKSGHWKVDSFFDSNVIDLNERECYQQATMGKVFFISLLMQSKLSLAGLDQKWV